MKISSYFTRNARGLEPAIYNIVDWDTLGNISALVLPEASRKKQYSNTAPNTRGLRRLQSATLSRSRNILQQGHGNIAQRKIVCTKTRHSKQKCGKYIYIKLRLSQNLAHMRNTRRVYINLTMCSLAESISPVESSYQYSWKKVASTRRSSSIILSATGAAATLCRSMVILVLDSLRKTHDQQACQDPT
jgi:hypothetical protein